MNTASRARLMAALALTLTSVDALAMPVPKKGSSRHYRPQQKHDDTALAREIAEHNEAVAMRRAAKKARKGK